MLIRLGLHLVTAGGVVALSVASGGIAATVSALALDAVQGAIVVVFVASVGEIDALAEAATASWDLLFVSKSSLLVTKILYLFGLLNTRSLASLFVLLLLVVSHRFVVFLRTMASEVHLGTLSMWSFLLNLILRHHVVSLEHVLEFGLLLACGQACFDQARAHASNRVGLVVERGLKDVWHVGRGYVI